MESTWRRWGARMVNVSVEEATSKSSTAGGRIEQQGNDQEDVPQHVLAAGAEHRRKVSDRAQVGLDLEALSTLTCCMVS